MGPLTVEIWSDVVCPWCYVGKRRFERALAAFDHGDEVQVTWRSFQLDPTAPRGDRVDVAFIRTGPIGATLSRAAG